VLKAAMFSPRVAATMLAALYGRPTSAS
jgi:hypothetical protein